MENYPRPGPLSPPGSGEKAHSWLGFGLPGNTAFLVKQDIYRDTKFPPFRVIDMAT